MLDQKTANQGSFGRASALSRRLIEHGAFMASGVRISGQQGVRISGQQGVRISGQQGVRISGCGARRKTSASA